MPNLTDVSAIRLGESQVDKVYLGAVRVWPLSGLWLNRTVLTGSSVAQNGTSSHTCAFTPATSGNYLVAIVAGGVTFSTPAGWTELVSAVGNAGLYVFTKTAASAESSFTTTHNGTNYPIRGVVYEFAAGTSALGSNGNPSQPQGVITGPTLSGLSGTYTRFAARSNLMTSNQSVHECDWTVPSQEDYDAYVPHDGISREGIQLSIAYDAMQTAASYTANFVSDGSYAPDAGEAVVFALIVP